MYITKWIYWEENCPFKNGFDICNRLEEIFEDNILLQNSKFHKTVTSKDVKLKGKLSWKYFFNISKDSEELWEVNI